jgi:hypothetical protein
MLGMTVIRFNDLTRGVSEFRGPRTPVGGTGKENPDGVSQRLRVWNHLCLIHLQYVPFPRLPCVFHPSSIIPVSQVFYCYHKTQFKSSVLCILITFTCFNLYIYTGVYF